MCCLVKPPPGEGLFPKTGRRQSVDSFLKKLRVSCLKFNRRVPAAVGSLALGLGAASLQAPQPGLEGVEGGRGLGGLGLHGAQLGGGGSGAREGVALSVPNRCDRTTWVER